jgi:uncharacterized protein
MPARQAPQGRATLPDNAAVTDSCPTAPIAVLDTNVVLDWLVFRDPSFDPIAHAIVGGRLRWIATAPMRDELAHVLARGHLDAWRPDPTTLWARWDAHCMHHPVPAVTAPPGRFRCSDPDDQKFVDLARAAAADCLLTRDRALLRLAGRLRTVGVRALTPAQWSLAPGG